MWSGGIANPLSVIEQLTYLLFIKRLDELHTLKERKASHTGKPIDDPIFSRKQDRLRWSRFKELAPEEMFSTVKDEALPFIRARRVPKPLAPGVVFALQGLRRLLQQRPLSWLRSRNRAFMAAITQPGLLPRTSVGRVVSFALARVTALHGAKDIKRLNSISLTILFAVLSITAHAKDVPAIELSRVIEAFMTSSSNTPDWSMGAGKSTPQIIWTSSGVETGPDCRTYEACRHGTGRIMLDGKEIQHLRKRLEPIRWELFMASESTAKFEPQRVEISPSCDSAECYFDFKKVLNGSGLTLTQLCKAGLGSFRQTAYEVKKENRRTFIIVDENTGSGGKSTSLTLIFNRPSHRQDLCAEARAYRARSSVQ